MAEKRWNNDLITWLDVQFKKAPHLPASIRQVLIKITPVLSLVFGVLGIIASLGMIGVSPFGAFKAENGLLFSGIFSLASSVLLLMAYPKLKKMQYRGWIFLFWSEIISAFSAIFPPSLGAVIGLVIGLYILFEIKSQYK